MSSLAASITDRIARKVGEGYERPDGESQLPIDVNYAKLAEWLVDRKQVPADWNRRLQAIQSKVAAAIKELPPGYLGQFEGGEELPIDYLRSKEIMDKLTQTAEKNFLGSYKGAAGEWDKIIRAYEYNMLHIGEAALSLGRNGDFEIPLLKKQASKYQQQMSDLEKKQGEAKKSAAAAASAFQQECNLLGIDGKNIRRGLLALTANLPVHMKEAVQFLKSETVGRALEYYHAFAKQISNQSQASDKKLAGDCSCWLSVLQEIRENRTERPDCSGGSPVDMINDTEISPIPEVHRDTVSSNLKAEYTTNEQIETSGKAVIGGINLKLGEAHNASTTSHGGSGGEGISWELGDLLEGADDRFEAHDGNFSNVEASIDISWDIDVTTAGEEGAGQLGSDQSKEVTVEYAAAGGAGIATFADAPAAVQRLIEDPRYRARLMDDLFEIQAFLNQRHLELTGKGNELLVSSVPQTVQHIGANAVASMQQCISDAISSLTGSHLQQLLLLRSSPHYLDRRTAALEHKAGQEAKFIRAAMESAAKQSELQRLLMTDAAKLAVLVKHTRALKSLVETVLGLKLGRRVNIMGEINNLF